MGKDKEMQLNTLEERKEKGDIITINKLMKILEKQIENIWYLKETEKLEIWGDKKKL